MRVAAAVVTLIVLVLFFVTMHIDPATFGWLRPRGGLMTLSISLLLANGAIWLGADPHRDLRRRFELTVAGWLWLLVQMGALAWFCIEAR